MLNVSASPLASVAAGTNEYCAATLMLATGVPLMVGAALALGAGLGLGVGVGVGVGLGVGVGDDETGGDVTLLALASVAELPLLLPPPQAVTTTAQARVDSSEARGKPATCNANMRDNSGTGVPQCPRRMYTEPIAVYLHETQHVVRVRIRVHEPDLWYFALALGRGSAVPTSGICP
jgi:hypothetical protein